MTCRGGYLGIYGGAQSSGVSAPIGYASKVRSISGLLSYWRCDNTSSFLDDESTRDGTYSNGTPTHVDALLTGSTNGGLGFAGPYAEIPHDVGLELSSVTLSFWIRVNSFPVEGGVNTWPIAKDASGLSEGHFGIGLSDTGELFARFQTASTQLDGVSTPVEQGTAYHILIICDSNGLSLYKDGQYVGIDTGYTGGWSVNTEVLRIARAEFSSTSAFIELDEIALYNRALSESEIITLSNVSQSQLPTAVDIGPLDIEESSSTEIDLLSGSTYIGSAPTVTITDKSSITTAGHDVTVNASGIATLVTIAVSGDDVGLTFDYNITDANGTSPDATVTVNVLDTPISPTDPILQEYTPSGSTTEVASISALISAVNSASAGDRILLAPGTYSGGTQTITSSNGIAGSPVVLEPRDGYGTVTINSPLWTLNNSRYVVIRGFYFNNAQIIPDGGCEFTRIMGNRFRQIGRKTIYLKASRYTRVDHNDVSEYTSGTRGGFVTYDQPTLVNNANRDVLVDYNYIHDINPSSVPNGSSILGIEGATNVSQKQPGFTVDKNLFHNISLPGEGELFGAKFSGWVVSRCTFTDNVTSIYLNAARFGGYWSIESCWFEDNRTRFLNVIGLDQVVKGCRFEGTNKMCIGDGTYDWPPELPGNRPRANGTQLVGNTGSLDGFIEVGRDIFSGNGTLEAIDTNLWANISDQGGNAHTIVNSPINTTFTNPSISYSAAVKLTTADVGPNAL
jgi:hypothetical protein